MRPASSTRTAHRERRGTHRPPRRLPIEVRTPRPPRTPTTIRPVGATPPLVDPRSGNPPERRPGTLVPLGTTHQSPPPATHPRALAPAMPSMGGRGAASRDLTRNPRTAQPEPPRRRSPPSADQGRGASSRYLMSTHTATCHTCPPGEFLLVRTDIYRDPRPGTSLPPTPPVRPCGAHTQPAPTTRSGVPPDCTPDKCPGRAVCPAWSCVLGCAFLDARSGAWPACLGRGTR